MSRDPYYFPPALVYEIAREMLNAYAVTRRKDSAVSIAHLSLDTAQHFLRELKRRYPEATFVAAPPDHDEQLMPGEIPLNG